MYILGQHEIFGLEEMIAPFSGRQQSVYCHSSVGDCYFIGREQFVSGVNRYGFSEAVLEE